MKHVSKLILVMFCGAMLVACGDSDSEQKAATKPMPANSKTADQKPANKPFAQEQQLIREAGKIQGVLDQDAQEKKKAIEEAN